MFPHCGCLFGFGCCVTVPCFIPCNIALQKMLSSIAVTYQVEAWSSVKFLGTRFSVSQLVVDNAMLTTQ